MLTTPYPNAEYVDHFNKIRYIKLPRLIHLIRVLLQSPVDHVTQAKAIALATELYIPTLDHWLAECYASGLIASNEHKTLDVIPAAICLTPLTFRSSRIFTRFIQYHSLRTILSGCTQTLTDICPRLASQHPAFNPSAVTQTDIYSASQLAACWDYVSQDPSPLRARQLFYNWPLIFSFGTWCRLEARHLRSSEQVFTSTDNETLITPEIAAAMKCWITQRVVSTHQTTAQSSVKNGNNSFLVDWRLGPSTKWNAEGMTWLSGVLAGGDLW